MTKIWRNTPRRHHATSRALAVAAAFGVLTLSLSIGVAGAQSSHPQTTPPSPPAPCGASALRESAATNLVKYSPTSIVTMTATVRNTSTSSCSVEIGGTSPYFTITNASDQVVWRGCNSGDGASACAMYLMAKALAPGKSFAKTVSWDQRADATLKRVPRGSYTLSVDFDGVSGHATSTFNLAAVSSPETVRATAGDNGRHFLLHSGDILNVHLANSSTYTWSSVVSSNAGVLSRTSFASGTASVATFGTHDSGQVLVTATDRPTCAPECATPSRHFSIRVNVLAWR